MQVYFVLYSGGKKNPDDRTFCYFIKKRTNESETAKQSRKTVNLYLKYNMYKWFCSF